MSPIFIKFRDMVTVSIRFMDMVLGSNRFKDRGWVNYGFRSHHQFEVGHLEMSKIIVFS